MTKIGRSFSSRVSASILNSIGLNELIVNTEKDYKEKALYFAKNRMELKKIKYTLNTLKNNSSLFNRKDYTKDLEEIYTGLIT